MPITTDYLVIGSGVAGLSFALEAAANGDVLVVTKRSADESNTKYAQGGIAAVLSTADSFEAHIADTLRAGAGLCHERSRRGVRQGGAGAESRCFATWEPASTWQREPPTTPTSTCTSKEATALAASPMRRT